MLGGHVRQAGSLVTERILRFDFTHHEALTESQTEAVENLVNAQILANTPLTVRECGREQARELGAKALFDEKYGDTVRVVSVPGFSTELCGGLHVRATGDIGCFKILREESIGSGTRRILAATGMNILELLQRLFGLRAYLTNLLSTDEEGLAAKTQGLVDELHSLQRRIQENQLRELTKNIEGFFERADVDGVLLQTGKFSRVAPDMLRDIGDRAKEKATQPTVVVMAVVGEDESCQIVVMADDEAVRRGAHAGNLVKEASSLLGGRGGGRPNTAQGGGKDSARLDEALARIEALLRDQLKPQ